MQSSTGSAGTELRAPLIGACDLGKATAKLLVCRLDPQAGLTVSSRRIVHHEGAPMDVFSCWYEEAQVWRCQVLGATGLHAGDIDGAGVVRLPEDACIEAALPLGGAPDGPINVVSIGARGYSVLSRDVAGRVNFLDNDKCSSGTGETMVKIASRFGLSIDEADRIAVGASKSIPITSRCSVFAKSEMTHFGNQGRQADQLFRGYFESVVRHVVGLLERTRVPGPIMLIGGASRLRSVVELLAELTGEPVVVPKDALGMEALGAAQLASEVVDKQACALPRRSDAISRRRDVEIGTLPPAAGSLDRVVRLAPADGPGALDGVPQILGIDLGSTGSKAQLTSVASGQPLVDVYDRTRGDPVGAMKRLVRALVDRAGAALDVRAVGVTGSGREAAATVLRAAYPDLTARIFVVNEIVAHATAAIRCDDEGGRSLSVVEIGGQDAKFIQIAGGQIVESDMNKACSAGTGSFLEEQAFFYGVDDIVEFGRLAEGAARPPDLGQMCTVFVADAAGKAHDQGFEVQDIFAGFQYSVIHNYIHRVMGPRTFGDRIFFQGKPATSPSLAWTLAAVTGRDVIVPPNPGAMGAWGVGLVCRDTIGVEPLTADDARFELGSVLEARVVATTELRCRDKRCATLCVIDKSLVEVGGSQHTVLSGGACPKYEIAAGASAKLPKDAPSAFDERARAVAPYLERTGHGRTVAVAAVGAQIGVIPWIVTLLRTLGMQVDVLQPDARSLSRGEERCYAYDACAPVKIAHGLPDTDAEILLFPKILDLPDRGQPGGKTCPMEQGLPELVAQSLASRGRRTKVLLPALPLARGLRDPTLLASLRGLANDLDVSVARMLYAATEAFEAQRRFEAALDDIGRRTLAYGKRHGIAVIAVCGPLHVIHEPAINAGIARIAKENGALALPMDCFAVPDDTPQLPRILWGDASRVLRVALAARSLGDVYPLLLSAFGCGPGSFTEQVFDLLIDGHPHTTLETDGHGGAAGYVTRMQAFLHTVRQHDRRGSAPHHSKLRLCEPLQERPLDEDRRSSRLVMFSMADRFSTIAAAFYRSVGFDAVSAGPNGPQTLVAARRDCSGKECLPYQLLWGSFRQHLEAAPPAAGTDTVLLQMTGAGMCRNCMFSVKDQQSLQRLGLSDRVRIRHYRPEPQFDLQFMSRFWAAVVVWDLLFQLAAYHRPFEVWPGEVDSIYQRYCDALEALTERPQRKGLRRAVAGGRWLLALNAIIDGACSAFARIGRRRSSRAPVRTALLTGDVYLRVDEFGSDRLIRRLNERGLSVLVEPLGSLVEYMAHERLCELVGLPTTFVENRVMRTIMKQVRARIYDRSRPLHPWLPAPDMPAVIAESRTMLARYPFGEAPITIGSALHAWKTGACDGVAVVGPWGCGPSLLAEGLLRHRREIPALYVYNDGSPIDERRLDAFAFRLKRAPPRSRGGVAPEGQRPRRAGVLRAGRLS